MYNPSAYSDKRLLDLTSCSFLSTYRRIDCDKFTNDLLSTPGIDITTDPSKWNLATPGYTEIYEIWKNSNFNSSAIKWTNYYPDKHNFAEVVADLASYLRVTTLRSWVSRVDPGFFAPWHWDVDDNENEYLKLGAINRYSIMLDKPAHGHIFVLGKDYLYDCPQGSIFKWKNYKEWHSGINAGFTPKFMLHLLAY